jgi:hypothetical protein
VPFASTRAENSISWAMPSRRADQGRDPGAITCTFTPDLMTRSRKDRERERMWTDRPRECTKDGIAERARRLLAGTEL